MTGKPEDAAGVLARRQRLGRWLGAGTALAGVLLMAAGSDRPPPPGFVVVIPLSVVVGMVVARGVPVALGSWDRRGRRRTIVGAVLLGAGIGLVIGCVVALANPPARTGVATSPADVAIWLVVLACVGSMAACTVAIIARAADRLGARDQP